MLRDLPALLFSSGRDSAVEGLAGRNPFVSGSNKEAITHHYDISNAFYRLFLDERMVYSCGYFKDFANGIDQAQFDKLDHICRKLRLKPGETLLDIGCGWGAMLIHAAKHYGVVGRGVSLSEAQTALARERIRAEGLEDRITIEVKPYSELTGQLRQDLVDRHVRASRPRQPRGLFPGGRPPAETRRHLPAPRDHPAHEARPARLAAQGAGLQGADQVHLSRAARSTISA